MSKENTGMYPETKTWDSFAGRGFNYQYYDLSILQAQFFIDKLKESGITVKGKKLNGEKI